MRRRWRGTLSSAGLSTPLNGDLRLEIGLWLPDRRRRDVDNCCKSICDALNGIVYLDENQTQRAFMNDTGIAYYDENATFRSFISAKAIAYLDENGFRPAEGRV